MVSLRTFLTFCVADPFAQMSETLIELAHTYMGEFEYGMYSKRNGGSSSGRYSRGVKRSRAVVPLSSKIQALSRKVALLTPERKQFTAATALANVDDSSGGILYVLPLVQGVTDVTRIGDKIRPYLLKMRIRTAGTASATLTINPETYCVTLIQDKESSGVIPSISGASNSIFSSFNPQDSLVIQPTTSDRFKILKQKFFSQNDVVSGFTSSVWDWSVALQKIMTYNATGGTVADASQNQLYLVVTTSDPTDSFDVTCQATLFFTDV